MEAGVDPLSAEAEALQIAEDAEPERKKRSRLGLK